MTWRRGCGISSADHRNACRPGQALAETALFTLPVLALAVGLALGVLVHRAMAVADAAATACVSTLAAEAGPAGERATAAARATVEGAWAGLAQAGVDIALLDGQPGTPVFCQVTVTLPLPLGRLLDRERLTYTATATALKEVRRGRW